MTDLFKEKFKYFKRKIPPPDYSSVIDFHRTNSDQEKFAEYGISKFDLQTSVSDHFEGLEKTEKWEAFQMDSHPGFIFVKNPFTQSGQEYWIDQCLDKFPQKPNASNLDNQLSQNQTWPWGSNGFHESEGAYRILKRLRWVTLGYHHNWDTKEYSEDFKGTFPANLASLSAHVARTIGVSNYRAEAAIINYYLMDSTISGHTDHSEKNLQAPLISFSFGQSAVFLLGGLTKTTAPTAIMIRSGDIVIMGNESRLCYHGVPRIIADPDFNCSNRWSEVMKSTRLNMNVRQVNFN